MTDKRGDFASRAIGGVAALLAGYFARKLITKWWTRATGKLPPEHPEDPEVGIAEALGWAVVTGVGVEAARLLANRAAAKRLHGPDTQPQRD
jgi:hypothetical protein